MNRLLSMCAEASMQCTSDCDFLQSASGPFLLVEFMTLSSWLNHGKSQDDIIAEETTSYVIFS